MWVILGIISSFLLGIYDLLKKSALQNNQVMPVLFLASLTSAFIFLPLILISSGAGAGSGLSFEDSLISVIAVLRRSSVLISFTAGAFLFREINLTRKSLVLAGILVGVIIIILGI